MTRGRVRTSVRGGVSCGFRGKRGRDELMRSVPTLRAHQYLYVARMARSFSGEEHISGEFSVKKPGGK